MFTAITETYTYINGIAMLIHRFLESYIRPLFDLLYYSSPGFLLSIMIPVLLTLEGTIWGGGKGNPPITVAPDMAVRVIWTLVVVARLNIFRQW